MKKCPTCKRPMERKRTLEQNSKMWPMLREISEKHRHYGFKLSIEEWKIVFSAAVRRQQAVPDLDGCGFVVLGTPTSMMTVSEMSMMLDLIEAFGVEHGVFGPEPDVAPEPERIHLRLVA